MKPGTRPERVGLSEATLSKETSFKGKALQAVVDSWCKIQVTTPKPLVVPPCSGKTPNIWPRFSAGLENE